MINVSEEFRTLMQTRRDFKEAAVVTLLDGTTLTFDANHFTCSNNTVSEGAGENALPLGCAISRTVQLEIVNDDETPSEYDFFGAQVDLSLKFQLADSVERIDMGTFTVLESETRGGTIVITAADAMYKADKPYTTLLTFPASAGSVFRDACTGCGIAYETAMFRNDNFQIDERPSEDLTFRQVLGYVAMLATGNVRINRSGKAEILTYDFVDLTAETSEKRHELSDWIGSVTVDVNDVTITGVKTTITVESESGAREEQNISYGGEGYILSIENPLISGKEQVAVDLIGEVLVGATFRKFSGEHAAYPLAEFMDQIKIVDCQGRAYYSIITDIDFAFCGGTSFSNSAASPARNSGTYQSPENKAVIKARQLVEQERTSREAAIAALSEKIANNNGLFMTAEMQGDGSSIYYLHDKPTLDASANVVRVTAEAFGFSTDGGETYPFGFEVTGDMVTKVLSAEGINGEWISIGSVPMDRVSGLSTQLEVADGKISAVVKETAELREKADDVAAAASSLEASTAEQLDNIQQTLKEQHTELISTSESIALKALESYVETSVFDTFKSTMKTDFEVWAGSIAGRVQATEDSIKNVDGNLQSALSTITKYFTFDIDGLTLGQVGNPNKVVIDNDEIAISVNGVEVQRFDSSGKALIPELNVTTLFNMLGYKISVDDSKNVNCEYVGG